MGCRLRAARLEFDEPQDDVAAVDLPDGDQKLGKLGYVDSEDN
jgi:hypothetical protein